MENILKGKEIVLSLPNGEKHKSQFAIVDLDNIIASHNEETFYTSEGYPVSANGRNINDRNYRDDKNTQYIVKSYARGLEPDRVITTSRTSSGTPIITKDGYVISGNNRTMSIKLARKYYPAKYNDYKKFLLEEAFAYGFDTGDIVEILSNQIVLDRDNSELTFNGKKKYMEIKNPILVRIDYDVADSDLNTKTLAKFNKDTKKSERPIDKAIKLSNVLNNSPNCLNAIADVIGDVETFSEFYSNIAPQKKLLNKFLECELILDIEIPMYFEGNTFNANGKNFIEQVLASSVLDEDSLIVSEQDGVKRLRQIIITSLPVLMANKQLKEGASLNYYLNKALVFQYNMIKGNFKFGDFLKQTSMFTNERYDYKAVVLNRLLNVGRNVFKSTIANYNQAIISEEAPSMFGDTKTKDEIFETIVSTKIPQQEEAQIMASNNVEGKPKDNASLSTIIAPSKPKPKLKPKKVVDVKGIAKMVDEIVLKYNYPKTRQFDLTVAKNYKEFIANLESVVERYSGREMAGIQAMDYLNEFPEYGKKYLKEHDIVKREKFKKHIKYLQGKLRKGIAKIRKDNNKAYDEFRAKKNIENIIDIAKKADADMMREINEQEKLDDSQRIVNNIGNGIITNKLFRLFLKSKSNEEDEEIKEEIRHIRFGTYKNMTLLDFLQQEDWKPNLNTPAKKEFIKLLKRIL